MSLVASNGASVGETDAALVKQLSTRIIKPLGSNLVERPWGGTRIRELKGMCPLPDQRRLTGMGIGESFEIAACDRDGESKAHPSLVRLPDGSVATLSKLLAEHGRTILGEAFTDRYGLEFPLLPKVLDIEELLSVQGHPGGNTEAYVIIDAEPGATIRLGFRQDVVSGDLRERLVSGRQEQQQLLALLGDDADLSQLQSFLKAWFCRRDGANAAEAAQALFEATALEAANLQKVSRSLEQLKSVYWHVLDLMNEIPVTAGLVLHNANPSRIVVESGRPASAEVHALGNPEEREIVALEIRKPGITLRAWDNVRFPVRDVDIDAALEVLSLRATRAEEFMTAPRPVEGREGVSVSIDSEYFCIEHLCPTDYQPSPVPDSPAHYLYALEGDADIVRPDAVSIGQLNRGESALVPAGIGGYEVRPRSADVHVLRVTVPV